MSELPAWAISPIFDASDWWTPVVCTGHGSHVPELLTLFFIHTEIGGVHYFATEHVNAERFGPTEDQLAKVTPFRSATSNRGSMNISCPACSLTPRIPRDEWGRISENAWRVKPPWVDVSLYG
jgi:hypothetical protein